MDHVLGRMSEKSGCGMSFGTVRITDLHFADDAVILVATRFMVASGEVLTEGYGYGGLVVCLGDGQT